MKRSSPVLPRSTSVPNAPKPPAKAPKLSQMPPIPGMAETNNPNDDRVVILSDDLLKLQRLAMDEPVVRACLRILTAATMSSGIELTREGKHVTLTSNFERHLSEVSV